MSPFNLYETERSLDPASVLEQINRYLSSQKFSATFATQNNESQVSNVLLKNKKNQVISEGSGKGQNHIIGALAETIEHHALEQDYMSDKELESTSKLIQQSVTQKDFILNSLCQRQHENIKVDQFKDLSGKKYFIPTDYINPTLNKHNELSELSKKLKKYATNSGTCFSSSKEDALLHAVNEIIERHYYSYFLLELIGEKSNVLWEKVKPKSSRYKHKIKRIEKTYEISLYSIACKSPYGTWVCLTFALDSNNKYLQTQISGGASINLELAYLRSLDEIEQILSLYSDEEAKEDEFANKVLSNYPSLSPIIKISANTLDKIVRRKEFLLELQNFKSKLLPAEQLAFLMNNLEKDDFKILFRQILKYNNIGVYQIYIPGMERFNLIRGGCLVAPQSAWK